MERGKFFRRSAQIEQCIGNKDGVSIGFWACVLTDTKGRIDPDVPGPNPFPNMVGSFSFEDEEGSKADETSTQRLQDMASKSLEKLRGEPVQRVWSGSLKKTLLAKRPNPSF